MSELLLNAFNSKQPIIITLTQGGLRSAKRIIRTTAKFRWHHLHQPKPFKKWVGYYFVKCHPLLAICSAGIITRTLGTKFCNKYKEGPVVVADESLQYFVPLLGAHQRYGNLWASYLAQQMNGQAVITSEHAYVKPFYILGLGCVRHCPFDQLRALIEQTMQKLPITLKQVSAIASIDVKSDEASINQLAQNLNIPFLTYSSTQLGQYAKHTHHQSDYVLKTVGVGNVCESAALAAAQQLNGRHIELILKKHKNQQATVAVACGFKN